MQSYPLLPARLWRHILRCPHSSALAAHDASSRNTKGPSKNPAQIGQHDQGLFNRPTASRKLQSKMRTWGLKVGRCCQTPHSKATLQKKAATIWTPRFRAAASGACVDGCVHVCVCAMIMVKVYLVGADHGKAGVWVVWWWERVRWRGHKGRQPFRRCSSGDAFQL
jgi:hypothetical protein